MQKINDGKQIIPTIVFEDGSILVEPSNAELARKLDITPKAKRSFYDLIVGGAGPAGLTAALYAAREGIETLVIERSGIGGQTVVTERIENYPGFPQGIAGPRLADQMRAHAERFGVEILPAQAAVALGAEGDYKLVRTDTGDEYCARTDAFGHRQPLPQAGGPRRRGLYRRRRPLLRHLRRPIYKGQDMVVVGGGNSGIEEGLFLTKFARKVTVLEVRDRLGASRILQENAERHPQMEIRLSTTVQEFRGNGRLAAVIVKNLKSGELEELKPGAVFVSIGLDPKTNFLQGIVDLNRWGFIESGETFETNIPGVYAAGDVRAGSTKQVTGAVGEGTTAALMIRQYLEKTEGNRGYKGD